MAKSCKQYLHMWFFVELHRGCQLCTFKSRGEILKNTDAQASSPEYDFIFWMKARDWYFFFFLSLTTPSHFNVQS